MEAPVDRPEPVLRIATLEDASSSLEAVKEAADDLGTEGCVL